MRQLVSMVSIWVILVSGCSAAADRNPGGDDEFTLPAPSGGRDKVTPGAATRTLTGTLGFDDIEGGCAFITAPDGRRYEVVYPPGWALDRSRQELRGGDGQLARGGEPVTVTGTLATDRSSTCQIGPIFVATEVRIGDD
jgi:hypothetical protein